MRPAMRLMVAGAAVAAVTSACAARNPPPTPPAADDKLVITGEGCPVSGALGGLPVRSADVQTPLAFLPWIKADLAQAKALAAPLTLKPYRAEDVDKVKDQIGELPFAQVDSDARVGGRVRAVVVACQPQGLDLIFHVYAVNPSKAIAVTWESRQRETAAPEQQGGQEALRKGLRLQPRLGYQAGEGLGAGASALLQRSAAPDDAYWRALAFDGYVSDRLRDLSFAAQGWHDPQGGLWAHVSWRLGYADQSAPAKAVSRLGQTGLEAQLLAQTRPLGPWALPLRLGAALDAGEHRSGGQDNAAAGLVADQHTQSLKLMAGTTVRLERQSLAASYAVEFGAGNGGAGSVDWIKQIVDVAHQGRWLVADHRSLSVDTRLTFGQLSERGVVPHSARFFAGGREQRFTGSEEWQIRSAPLLRSLSTNALAGVPSTPGYRRFAALNLTAAMPVYNVPLLPAELYKDGRVLPLVNGQLNTAVSSLANIVRSEMPPYREAIAHLPQVQQTLAAMSSAVAAAKPPVESEAFTACQEQIAQAQDDVATALDKPGRIGFFADLLPKGSDTLGQVATLCADDFNENGRSPQIARQATVLRASVDKLVNWFGAADLNAAKEAAGREIEPIRHIVKTLFNETNIVAISPLLMLDVVTLGPRLAGGPRTRIGLGTGVRATLVDSVDFSLGYMVNMRRQAGEARGAFFMAMEFKDPF